MKVKSHLKNIYRKYNEHDKSKYNFRLDQSERVTLFEKDFFDSFLKTLTQTDFITYPYLDELKTKIAIYNGVKKNNIFLTPGSDIGIRSVFDLCVVPKSEVISTTPSFPMYGVYSELYMSNIKTVEYEENLTYSIDKICNLINNKTSLIILANPNNPIGDYKTEEEIEPLLKYANSLNIPVLIDEAYVEFSPGTLKHFSFKYNNVCISRTFSILNDSFLSATTVVCGAETICFGLFFIFIAIAAIAAIATAAPPATYIIELSLSSVTGVSSGGKT